MPRREFGRMLYRMTLVVFVLITLAMLYRWVLWVQLAGEIRDAILKMQSGKPAWLNQETVPDVVARERMKEEWKFRSSGLKSSKLEPYTPKAGHVSRALRWLIITGRGEARATKSGSEFRIIAR